MQAAEQLKEPADNSEAGANTGATPEPTLEESLAEFDAAVPKAEPGEASDDGDMQKLAADALTEYQQQGQTDQRLAELQGENAQLRNKIWQESEQRDFKGLVADVQSKLPEHLPQDWAEKELIVAATKNPELRFAFDNRNVDRNAVATELRKVEVALSQMQRMPGVDQQKLNALYQYGYRLGLALNSKEIIRRATRDIVDRGRDIREVDHEMTENYYAVAQAVRHQGGKVAAEPPPNLGKMSNREFENYTRDNYGY